MSQSGPGRTMQCNVPSSQSLKSRPTPLRTPGPAPYEVSTETPTVVNGVDLQPIQLKSRPVIGTYKTKWKASMVRTALRPLCFSVAGLRPGEGHSQRPEWDNPVLVPNSPSVPTALTHLAWLLCALANPEHCQSHILCSRRKENKATSEQLLQVGLRWATELRRAAWRPSRNWNNHRWTLLKAWWGRRELWEPPKDRPIGPAR